MNLEKKKKILELQRVQTARMELEFKIDERMDEIERLKANIAVQEAKEAELQKEIENL